MRLGGLVRGAACAIAFSCAASGARADDVSLERMLAFADAHAPRILLARARLSRGVGARRAAGRTLSAPLTVTLGAGPRVTGSAVDADVTLSLVQPIEVAGERGARVDAADRLAARLDAELGATRWEVHRDVHDTFHRVIEARLRAEAATRRQALAEHLVEIATRRRDAGDIADLDVRMAEAELASARQEQLRVEGEFLDARLLLAELSGWPPDAPPSPAGGLDEPHTIADDATLVAYALESHPALLALEATVAEREANVRVAEVAGSPSLDVGLSLAREGAGEGPASYVGLLTLGVPIPVWDANSEAREEAYAERDVAEAERDLVRSVVAARVLRASAMLRASRARIDIYLRDVLPSLESNLSLLERGFDVGELDALEVAAAMRRVLDVERDAIDAFAQYHRALADLEAEVGREVVADDAHGHAGERAPSGDAGHATGHATEDAS